MKYITWISDNKISWTFKGPGMGPDPSVQISARPVSQEPMVTPFSKSNSDVNPHTPQYLVANLGMSANFAPIDLTRLTFPVRMRIDYIRIYQPQGAINVGCNPKNFPTEQYINQYVYGVSCCYYEPLNDPAYSRHIEAYTNPNLTTWVNDYHQSWPKNRLLGQC